MNVDAEQKCHNNVYMIEMYILYYPSLVFCPCQLQVTLTESMCIFPSLAPNSDVLCKR